MEGGRENSGSKEEKKKIIAAPHGRPTPLLPPQTAGFGFSGISPGPITLASSFFPEDPDSDCRSFSQLLAGAMNSPLANQRRVTDETTGESEVNCSGSAGRSSSVAAWSGGDGGSEDKVKGGCEMNSSFFTVPPGLSPGSLMDSPAFFSSSSHSQEFFGISHQQVLAQVTSQAVCSHSHTNDLEQNPPVSASTTSVLHPFSSIVSTFQQMTKQESDNKSITLDLPDGLHVDQRSQSSTLIVDKPADDGYNWRKYGQKQVKGSEYPRSYYKCTHTKCPVKKKVERSLDGQVTEIIYKGQHNHEKPPPGRRAREGVTLSNESNGISVMENGSDSQSGNFISSSETYRRDQESSQTAEQLSGSSDVEELADNEVGVTVKDEDLPDPKRRNVDAGFSKSGTLQKTVTEPRIIVQTTSEVDLLDDGFRWRKYGQKVVKGNHHPSSNSNKQLLFRQNLFGANGILKLCNLLRENVSIQSLAFLKCQLGSSGTRFLSSALIENGKLKELQIWEDSIGSEGAEELSKMIEVNSTLRILVILDVSPYYSTTATPVISAAIARNRKMEVHIWNKLDDSSGGILKVAELTPEDNTLRIYRLDISSTRRIAGSLGWNITVETVDMTGVRLNSRWAKEIRIVLENNSTIKNMILSTTCLRDKALVYIAAGLFKNKSLERLQLDGNWFSAVGVEHLLCPLTRFSPLIEQANMTLKVISLGGLKTKLSGPGKRAILEMLESNQTITSFEILEDISLKPSDIIGICRSLERNATLKQLSLKGCKGVEGESVLQAIVNLLQINPWIEEINLSGTPLDSSGKTEMIYQKLKNMGIKPDKDLTCDLPMGMPTICRVFFCGHQSSGKTMLANSVSSNFSSQMLTTNWNQIKKLVTSVEHAIRKPEVRINTLWDDDDTRVSIWELPSEQEFYTLHDIIFPGKGSPSFFLITCSLFNTSGNIGTKEASEIEEEILYWLRFIVSNSRRSQPQVMLPYATLVLTHFDKVSWRSEDLQPLTFSIEKLREKFRSLVDLYPTVFMVDARSSGSVSKLTHHLRKTSRTILERVPPIYRICKELVKVLQEWRSENNNKPVIKWNEFCQVCQRKVSELRIRWRYGDTGMDLRRRAVVGSLHRVSEVIFFEDLGFLILDIGWFLGEVLPQLLKLDIERNSTVRNGFISRSKIEEILRDKLHNLIPSMSLKVLNNLEAKDFTSMMLKLELCYEQETGNPNSLLLIPALLKEGKGQEKKWQLSEPGCVYVGRHLEVSDSSSMFLPAGFFPRLQVHLYNKIRKTNHHCSATYSLEKYLISININGIDIKVEMGRKSVYHVDILACSTKSTTEVLRLFQQLITPGIYSLCSGVNLSESIVRPDCVRHLIPQQCRKGQLVLLQQLKQQLLSIPAESLYEYQYTWVSAFDGTRQVLQSGFNYARDLLSEEEFREILQRRYHDLHHLATELAVPVDDDHGGETQEGGSQSQWAVQPSLSGIAKGVEEVLKRLRIIQEEIHDIKQEIQDLKYYEGRLLLELNQKMDYMINFNIQLEERKIPSLFYFTQIENYSKKLITRMVSGMTALRLHMLCEFRREMHVVEDQIGCELIHVDNQTVKSLLPYMSGFMKLLTIALKIGAHFIAGFGDIIPDLSREVAHLISSPPLFGTAATAAGGFIGAAAIGYAGRTRGTRGMNATTSDREGTRNFGKDMTTARQWLVDFFKDQGIKTGKDIAESFSLWRVMYKDNGQIAWICRRHLEARAYDVIEFPF